MSRRFLEDVRKVSGRCLKIIWKVFACCKEGLREYKESLLKARSSKDRCSQDRSSRYRTSQVRSSQDRSSWDKLSQDMSRQKRSSHDM